MCKLICLLLATAFLSFALTSIASAQIHKLSPTDQINLNDNLFGDVQFESTETVLADLNRGADVNYFSEDKTVLMAAVEIEKTTTAIALIDHGAKVDMRNRTGQTALIMASFYPRDRELKIAHALISHGASVNVQDKLGITPLQSALLGHNPAVANLLKASGAHIGFLEAVLLGDVPRVRSMIKSPIFVKSANLGRALRYAATAGETKMITLLLSKGVIVDATNADGETPLMYAAENGNAAAVTTLLDRGASMSARDKSGGSVVDRISGNRFGQAGMAAVLAVLLIHGLKVDVPDSSGRTLLVRYVDNFEPPTVELLLKRGADPNQKDSSGNTPLMATASWVQYDFIWGQEGYSGDNVRLLQKAGAKPDVQNKQGMTALMFAAGWRHPDVTKALLDGGTAVAVKDKLGRTALTWAARDGKDSPIVKALIAKGAKPSVADYLLMGNSENARAQISAGSDLKGVGPYAETTLMIAVEINPDLKIVSSLLDRGLDVNAKDDRGVTALMLAINPKLRVGPSQSGLLPAAPPGNIELVRLLLSHGADVKAVAKDKQSVEELAGQSGNSELISLIKAAAAK